MLARYTGSVRQNGVRGTLENIAALVDDMRFDWLHGTETGGTIGLDALSIPSINKHLGVEYAPSRVRAFRKLMDWLQLPRGRVFMDFGCGKGRVLCAAADYPFRRIVGVEFAAELSHVCRRNIATCRQGFRPGLEVSVIEGDATRYSFRGDEDVLFFFNPFRPPVMERVVRNIHASLAAHPRTVMLIVSNADELEPVLGTDLILRKVGQFAYGSTHFALYANGSF